MHLYFAPLEGITNGIYRRIHGRHFPPLARYFTPFFTPNSKNGLSAKDLRELSPEGSEETFLVPQLLTNRSEDFSLACQALSDLGYGIVNLNLGCPSGTVVSKGKGSGFLAKPDELRRFFDEVFSRVTVSVSIKTRIGVSDSSEFPALLEIFNDYPLEELIVHPRLRQDFYKGRPDLEAFCLALERSRAPVVYSGDLFTAGNVSDFQGQFPAAKSLMLGRGLIANPALARQVQGGAALTLQELRGFHDELYAAYRQVLSGQKPVLHKMKELWHYMICLFADRDKHEKALRKAQSFEAFQAAAAAVFRDLALCPAEGYCSPGGLSR